MLKTRQDTEKYLRVFLEAHQAFGNVNGHVFIVCRNMKLKIVTSFQLRKGDLQLLMCPASDLAKELSVRQWDSLVVKLLSLAHVLKIESGD